MKSVQKWFSRALILGLALFGAQAWSAPIAKVLRAGTGRINVTYPWPEGYKLPASGPKKKYTVRRLEAHEVPRVSSAVRETWDVSRFTDLGALPAGAELEDFQVVVHGLELRALHPSLAGMSFDAFIGHHFNSSVPTGIDFVRLYPYFFHKKTVISASIVNAFNTATFGYSGFILSVPKENYLACSEVDMHTPTDRDFYNFTPPRASSSGAASAHPMASLMVDVMNTNYDSFGPEEMKKLYQNHPLRPLNEFLPSAKVETRGTPARRVHASGAEELQRQDLLRAILMTMNATHLMGGVETQSWYNEVAITPVAPTREGVEISGIFIRAANSPQDFEAVMARPEVKILLELAEVFNLPVLQIYDGQYYETDVGE